MINVTIEGCTEACTRTPECTTCGRTKKLIGRDYAPSMGGCYCDHECSGYREDPYPGHLWPSEWRELQETRQPEGAVKP